MDFFDPGGGNLNVRRYTDEEMNGWWDVSRVGEWYGSNGAGKPIKVEITQEKLQQIAEDYNPELHYAPVTTDHADEGGAIGYVEAVRLMGDKLQAKVSWADWGAWSVKGRSYVNRSIEMYDPMKATGRAYLAGFTFLGAGKPAAKGLSPTPALLKDGQEITIVSDNRMNLEEMPEMELTEKSLKEKIIGWFKAGEITTPEQENDEVELKEAMAQNATLSEQNTALTTERDNLKTQLAEKEAELAVMKEAQAKAERTGKIEGFKANLAAMVEAGKITPAEHDREIALAEAVSEEKLEAHLADTTAMYKARKLDLLGERTPEKKTAAPVMPTRTAENRRIFEAAEDPEERKIGLLACDMADADATGKLSVNDAIKLIRTQK